MRLILREKTIEEAALKSSDIIKSSAYQGILMQLMKGYPAGQTVIDVPIKELIYEKSKSLAIGATLLYYGNILNQPLKNNKDLIAAWIPEQRSFKKEFLDEVLSKSFPVGLAFDMARSGHDLGTTGIGKIGKHVMPSIVLHPARHKRIEDMQDTIRHETQHITQVIGDLCIYHFELLKRAGFDFTKIEEPDYTPGMMEKTTDTKVVYLKTVGRGKMPTNAPPQGEFKYDDSLSEKENEARFEEWIKQYFRDDAEFETWTSDLAEKCVKAAVEQGQLTPVEIVGSYLVSKFPMFAGTKMNESVADIKALKAIAAELKIDYDRLRKVVSMSAPLSQLAIGTAREVTSNEYYMDLVSDTQGNKLLKKALQQFPKIRPKEFMMDLAKQIEQVLKDIVEQRYPFLKK